MISACLILRNNEKTIDACLNSLPKDITEIVCVIDSRSEDATEQICRHYTNNVYVYEWTSDSFADARNYAISKISNEWYFTIDGDEEVIQWEFKNIADYGKVWIQEPDGSMYESIRLAKKHLTYKWSTHEQVKANGKETTFPVVIRNNSVMTEEEIQAKNEMLFKRYLKQLETEPDNVSLNFYIQRALKAMRRWQDCIDYANLALFDPIPDGLKAHCCISVYLAYKHLGKPQIAVPYLNLSLSLENDQYLARLLMYGEAKEKNKPELCSEIKEQILTTESKLDFDITKQQTLNLIENESII